MTQTNCATPPHHWNVEPPAPGKKRLNAVCLKCNKNRTFPSDPVADKYEGRYESGRSNRMRAAHFYMLGGLG